MNISDKITELANYITGDLLTDDITMLLYSSGGSMFKVKPAMVIRPQNRDDVIKALKFATENNFSVTARGAATGRTGNELGSGIILDFSKYMHDILEFNEADKWVRVQPGVVLSTLNAFLKPYNLFFSPDPSSKDQCTIGGMIANNASGPFSVKYGTTRKHVISLNIALANGKTLITEPRNLHHLKNSFENNIYQSTAKLLVKYETDLKNEKPNVTKNSSGFHLWDIKDNDDYDLTPLFVGSEGSLGIFTEATLKLMPLPKEMLSGLIYFNRLQNIDKAILTILKLHPLMLEIIEKQILDMTREEYKKMLPYLPEGTEALLYVAFDGNDKKTLQEKFAQLKDLLIDQPGIAGSLKLANNNQEIELFAKLRNIAGPLLSKVKGSKKPIAFIEDTAVHPEHLPEYIKNLRNLFKKHNINATLLGHAGDGNLHTLVFLDLTDPDDVQKMTSLSEDVYELVIKLKGTISAEHGDGRLRNFYLKKQYPNLCKAFTEIKNLFDPQNILNPELGNSNQTNLLNLNHKHPTSSKTKNLDPTLELSNIIAEIENCSGCGKCRTYCPICNATSDELKSARGKATLLREIVAGEIQDPFKNAKIKEIMDSCINCKNCLRQCPTGVNIPWVSILSKAEFIKNRGDTFSNNFLTDTGMLFDLGSSLAPIANFTNTFPPARVAMEKVFNVDKRRKLPEFASNKLRKRKVNKEKQKKDIVFFLSCHSNVSDPLPNCHMQVLEKNGFNVITPKNRCCGMAKISSGNIKDINDDILFNLKLLTPYVEQGIDIIFSEPSCLLAFKTEYEKIQPPETVKKVADHCYDIHQYLVNLHRQNKLNLDMKDINMTIGYHNPCHLRAVNAGSQPLELLNLIPGLKIKNFSSDCCGMGGIFGLKKNNFDLSMKVGKSLFEEIDKSEVEMVSTSCAACKMQIEQGCNITTVQPIYLLAKAYKLDQK